MLYYFSFKKLHSCSAKDIVKKMRGQATDWEKIFTKDICEVLTGVAQLVEHRLTNLKGLISGQGPCVGCGFGPWLGFVHEANNNVSFLH